MPSCEEFAILGRFEETLWSVNKNGLKLNFKSFYTHKGLDTNFWTFGKVRPTGSSSIVPTLFLIGDSPGPVAPLLFFSNSTNFQLQIALNPYEFWRAFFYPTSDDHLPMGYSLPDFQLIWSNFLNRFTSVRFGSVQFNQEGKGVDTLGGLPPPRASVFFSTWKSDRHTWKKLVSSAWKSEPLREKIIKSAREKRILCVKFFRKSDFSKKFHAQNREIPISACKTENCPYVKIFGKVPVKVPDCAWNF